MARMMLQFCAPGIKNASAACRRVVFVSCSEMYTSFGVCKLCVWTSCVQLFHKEPFIVALIAADVCTELAFCLC